MGVRSGSRRLASVIAGLLGLGLLALTVVTLVERDRRAEPADVQDIFEEPDSFCEAFAFTPFSVRVRNVELAFENNQAPQAVRTVTAGLLERMARLQDTPADLRAPIRGLADDVSHMSTKSGDEARTRAAPLDRRARAQCG